MNLSEWEPIDERLAKLEQDVTLLLARIRSAEFVIEELVRDSANHESAFLRQRHALMEAFPAE